MKLNELVTPLEWSKKLADAGVVIDTYFSHHNNPRFAAPEIITKFEVIGYCDRCSEDGCEVIPAPTLHEMLMMVDSISCWGDYYSSYKGPEDILTYTAAFLIVQEKNLYCSVREFLIEERKEKP